MSLNSGLNIEKLLLIQQNQPGKFKPRDSNQQLQSVSQLPSFFFGL